MHALRYEMTDCPGSVAQTKQKRCRGILGEVRWGERFFSGKLHHDVSKRERKIM
jgi:hypothetical protein